MLRLLREYYFYANLRKCSLFQTNVHYIGHFVSKGAIVVDREKVRAIMEWEDPRNVYEVRSFMGLVSYYRRFIRNLYCIAYPITSL